MADIEPKITIIKWKNMIKYKKSLSVGSTKTHYFKVVPTREQHFRDYLTKFYYTIKYWLIQVVIYYELNK